MLSADIEEDDRLTTAPSNKHRQRKTEGREGNEKGRKRPPPPFKKERKGRAEELQMKLLIVEA